MYNIKSVVCDYGLYDDENLILITNSFFNLKLILEILNRDSRCNIERYQFNLDDYYLFLKQFPINYDTIPIFNNAYALPMPLNVR